MSDNIEIDDTQSAYQESLSATYDVGDDKLRLYSLFRLAKEDYQAVCQAGFRHAPEQECFYAKWSPEREDLLSEWCHSIEDEGMSALDRAENKADRFERYRESRLREAKQANKVADNIARVIDGQGVIVGHHSEKKARSAIKRMRSNYNKASDKRAEADYWQHRAKATVRYAQKLDQPDVRHRRIKSLEAEKRKTVKQLEMLELTVQAIRELSEDQLYLKSGLFVNVSRCFTLEQYPRPESICQLEEAISLKMAVNEGIITALQGKQILIELYEKNIVISQRWVDHFENRIIYEKAILCEQEGTLIEDKWQDMQVGGRIRVKESGRIGWHTIKKINKRAGKVVSVSARDESLDANDFFANWKCTLEHIAEYQAPAVDTVSSKQPNVVICNFPGEGIDEMTSEQWKNTHSNYKDIITIVENGVEYKIRKAMSNGSLSQVYLTDKSIVLPSKGNS